MALGFPVVPMRATLGSMPRTDDGWAYEVKWDGYRTVAFVDGGRVRLQSSSGLDVTARYPELAALSDGVSAHRAVLDGELVVVDDEGRPRFELLQQHRRPAALFVFDVLSVDDRDMIDLAYDERREVLSELVTRGSNWMLPASYADGRALLDATAERELEGLIAKRRASRYRPGTRTKEWVKVKHRRRIVVVIGGYTAGTGARASTFGSLLVGLPADGELVFAGGVGSGFSERALVDLTSRLRDLQVAECPFTPLPPPSHRRNATWVEPVLTATVEMAELTNDGLVRQASFVDLHDS